MIRLGRPSIDDTDLAAVADALRSGQLVQGPRVAAFEEALRGITGAAHAVAVSSGTAALHLALLAEGVAPGDAVIVPAYTWPATANVVELCGARCVFVDVDPESFDADPAALAHALSREGAAGRCRAILPVHPFGGVAAMPEILSLAERHGVAVIEDAACALGSRLGGRGAGRFGVMGCFSFHPRKSVTTGEGGAVVTDSPDLARRLRILRNHGLDPDAATPDFVAAGFNYRLSELAAALGATQLAKLPRILAARRRLAARYDAAFARTPVVPQRFRSGCEPAYQSYVVRLPSDAAARRPELLRALAAAGVEANLGTWHVPLTRHFRTTQGHRPGDFPGADEAFARSLALPLHDQLSDAEQDRVVRALLTLLS
jgi:dTDP-4-amino-4,6-dideoxygalactose transaminase